MVDIDKKEDMLCLMNASKISSFSSYSNISEYCLRNNPAVRRFFLRNLSDSRYVSGECSDFELLAEFLKIARKASGASVAKACKKAIEGIVSCDIDDLSASELWRRSSLEIEKIRNKELPPEIDKLGVAVFEKDEVIPPKIGDTEIIPIACPLGEGRFDSLKAHCNDGTEFENLLERGNKIALFIQGFEFLEPNEYEALSAIEKRLKGKGLSDKDRKILNSQLCRNTFKHCFNEQKELMIFLPAAPDVPSMGESVKLLDYIDSASFNGQLKLTVFASDAVGACFADSLITKKYKKITADTGMCGNGCGLPSSGVIEGWEEGGAFDKQASLATTPAFLSRY